MRLYIFGKGALSALLHADVLFFEQPQIVQLHTGLDDARLPQYHALLGLFENDRLFIDVEDQHIVADLQFTRQLVVALFGVLDRVGGFLERLETALEFCFFLRLIALFFLRLFLLFGLPLVTGRLISSY